MAMSDDGNRATGHWLEAMALLRSGPDTGELARHLNPPGQHLKGCLCPECAELRAAVGRGLDKHTAAIMNAKERGKAAAEQEITAQRRLQAAALAKVNRELAGYGTYPYRMAREEAAGFITAAEPPMMANYPRGDCTCAPPAWKPGSSYWSAHKPGCPMKARLRAVAGYEALKQEQPVSTTSPEPEPPADPEQEIVAALREFDTWSLAGPQFPPELRDTGTAPAGKCRECHLGLRVNHVAGLCFWCQLAAVTRNENRGLESRRKHGPDHTACGCRACRRRQVARALYLTVLVWAAAMLVILTVFGNLRWRLG